MDDTDGIVFGWEYARCFLSAVRIYEKHTEKYW